MSCHVTSYIMSCHVTSYHIMSYHIIYHFMSYHISYLWVTQPYLYCKILIASIIIISFSDYWTVWPSEAISCCTPSRAPFLASCDLLSTCNQAKFISMTLKASVNFSVKDRPGLQYSYTAYRLVQHVPRLLQRRTETELNTTVTIS